MEDVVICNTNKAPSPEIKRILDISFLIIISPVLLILILIISILIKITSKGPIIFTQYRIGKNGKLFKMYKFRTMHLNAEKKLLEILRNKDIKEEWIKTRKLKQDPRITKFGRFLRKTSLDELPQFINVLKGDMSIVGPRPYLPDELEEIGDNASVIFSVLPGITGLWQTNGRSNTTFKHRVKIDCLYIKNWNIWLDILITLKTFKVIMKGDGAY